MRMSFFSAYVLLSTSSFATTLVSPASPCDNIIHELRAGNGIPDHERISKLSNLYKMLLIPSLTVSDLEGLLASPVEFRNWSTSTLQVQVGERLDEMRKEISARLSVTEQTRFLEEIAPAIIREVLREKTKSQESWAGESTTLSQPVSVTLNDTPYRHTRFALAHDDEKLFLTSQNSKVISEWNLKSNTHVELFKNDYWPDVIATSVDGRSIYLGGRTNLNYNVYSVWDSKSKQIFHTTSMTILRFFWNLIKLEFAENESKYTAIATSSHGNYLYLGSSNNKIFIKNIPPNKQRHFEWNSRHKHGIQSLVASRDGRFLYSAGGDGKVFIWDLSTRKKVAEINTENYLSGRKSFGILSALAISKDGNTLYIADSPDILVWDLKNKNLRNRLKGQEDYIHSLAISPDENYLYSGSRTAHAKDNILTKWNLKKLELLHEKGEAQ
jgi:tricorn protease-like protein